MAYAPGMDQSCPNCTDSTSATAFVVHGRRVLRCLSCGLEYAAAYPDLADADEHIYPAAYFEDAIAKARERRPVFRELLAQIHGYVQPPGRLLDVGADVLAMHQDAPATLQAAEARNAFVIGYNSDMSAFAPNAHLTAPIWNWGPFYVDTVKKVQAGTWKAEATWPGLNDGIVDLAPMSDMVPQEVQDKVMAKKEAIKGGEKVFVGPIKDQEVAEKVAAGAAMSDEELLGMTWFVQGVIGTTE